MKLGDYCVGVGCGCGRVGGGGGCVAVVGFERFGTNLLWTTNLFGCVVVVDVDGSCDVVVVVVAYRVHSRWLAV